MGPHRQRTDLHIPQPQPASKVGTPREVLPGHQHLNQRVISQRPGRIEPLDKRLKRHILMLEGRQAARPHLSQQLSETGITLNVDPQHQRIDEKPHQPIKSRITPASHRKPHRHIRAGTQLRQQHRQRGLHHHKTAGPMLAGDPGHPLLQLRRPHHHHLVTAIISYLRIRPIGGQLQPFRHPRQRLFPKHQLRRNSTTAIRQLPQIGPLPQRVIDILHRQRRPPRRSTPTPAGISHTQISGQRSHRPPISSDMVHHHHQHILALTDHQQLHPHRNLGGQIKTPTHHRRHGLPHPAGRPTAGIDNPPTQPHPLNRNNHLLRHPRHRAKHRPQTLMPAHHISPRRPQRRHIQPTTQPHRPRHVVNRRGPLHLIDEPQPTLRKRQRHHRRPHPRHQRTTPTRRTPHPRRQPRHRRRLKQRPHRQPHIQRIIERSDHPHRQQRIPAKIEKRVINTDLIQP
ncbi:hypothetical protein MKSMC1_15280 [Mycobacterium kansasii]|nr:hypothetical protein MKSMC1_15280 [Mycobacterium kansasii]